MSLMSEGVTVESATTNMMAFEFSLKSKLDPCASYEYKIELADLEDSDRRHKVTWEIFPIQVERLTFSSFRVSVEESKLCRGLFRVEIMSNEELIRSSKGFVSTFEDLQSCENYLVNLIGLSNGQQEVLLNSTKVALDPPSDEELKSMKPRNLGSSPLRKSLELLWNPPEFLESCVKNYEVSFKSSTANENRTVWTKEPKAIFYQIFACANYTFEVSFELADGRTSSAATYNIPPIKRGKLLHAEKNREFYCN